MPPCRAVCGNRESERGSYFPRPGEVLDAESRSRLDETRLAEVDLVEGRDESGVDGDGRGQAKRQQQGQNRQLQGAPVVDLEEQPLIIDG